MADLNYDSAALNEAFDSSDDDSGAEDMIRPGTITGIQAKTPSIMKNKQPQKQMSKPIFSNQQRPGGLFPMQQQSSGGMLSSLAAGNNQQNSSGGSYSQQQQQQQQSLGINSRIKYFPWADWDEWKSLQAEIRSLPTFKDISSQKHEASEAQMTLLNKCLRVLTLWLAKNTSIISSAQNASPHSKYLKMQKIILEELKERSSTTSKHSKQTKAGLLSSNLRLIQLVEMGASTSKYRKTKQGGKIAMKNIAEELNFPTALVSLRHQAVHESRDGGMHSGGIIIYAFTRLQEFLNQNYWQPIDFQLAKRANLLNNLFEQISCYQVCEGKKLPLFFEIGDIQERRKTLARFTKANIKVPKMLDPKQLSDLVSYLIDSTLFQIRVQFTNFSRLNYIVSNFKTVQGEKEIGSLVLTSLKLKSEFLCFVFSLERKFSPFTIQTLLATRIVSLFVQECIELSLVSEPADDGERSINDVKTAYERIFKLISLFSLVRQCQANELDLTRLLSQQLAAQPQPTRLPALIKQMRSVYQMASFSFFAWYLKSRIQAQSRAQGLTTVNALLKAQVNENVLSKQNSLTQGQLLNASYQAHVFKTERQKELKQTQQQGKSTMANGTGATGQANDAADQTNGKEQQDSNSIVESFAQIDVATVLQW